MYVLLFVPALSRSPTRTRTHVHQRSGWRVSQWTTQYWCTESTTTSDSTERRTSRGTWWPAMPVLLTSLQREGLRIFIHAYLFLMSIDFYLHITNELFSNTFNHPHLSLFPPDPLSLTPPLFPLSVWWYRVMRMGN